MKTTTKLRVIADALNVSLEWLETGDGEKERPEVASQPAGLERSKIAAAVRISHYVRDAALEPMSDERYVEVLAAALQLVAEQPE
ncbi:hypothetical protein, partial [Paraburkholderia sp. SIMBA_054]|uniref:hypothetical protein n=1 Tax=Paraburkholderia sp. SIMBA_054 TaxID=3085795 RepID=UPI00397AA5D1